MVVGPKLFRVTKEKTKVENNSVYSLFMVVGPELFRVTKEKTKVENNSDIDWRSYQCVKHYHNSKTSYTESSVGQHDPQQSRGRLRSVFEISVGPSALRRRRTHQRTRV
jgi:hypothetical protein